jgi:hypothetical protein
MSKNVFADSLIRGLDPVELCRELAMVPDPWQVDVLRSRSPRILLNAARQSGKSTVAALLALHVALFQRGSTVLVLSPGQRQSKLLFDKSVQAYRSLGRPLVSESESALSLRLENGSQIVALPGTAALIRGYSVRLLVVDEASRVPDDVYAAVRPALAVSGGRILAISTPAGQRGWWFEAWQSKVESWQRFEVPAMQCPRIPRDYLEAERLSNPFFASEYECSFVAADPERVFPADALARAFDHRGEAMSWPSRERERDRG